MPASVSIRKFIGGIIWTMLSPLFVYGQLLDPVSFQISALEEPVHQGEPFIVTIEASIDDEWHLYSILDMEGEGPIPTTISSASYHLALAGEVKESEAEKALDPNFGRVVGWHSGQASFRVPVVLHAPPGVVEIAFFVRYQSCDQISCLPPRQKRVTAQVTLQNDSSARAGSEGS